MRHSRAHAKANTPANKPNAPPSEPPNFASTNAPTIALASDPQAQQPKHKIAERGRSGGDGGDGGQPDIDPIIKGLLARLPKSGEVWPEAERKLWLQLLEGSFKLIYKDKAERHVEIIDHK